MWRMIRYNPCKFQNCYISQRRRMLNLQYQVPTHFLHIPTHLTRNPELHEFKQHPAKHDVQLHYAEAV